MRFGLLQEGHCQADETWFQRYHDMIAEAVLAEQCGFDFYGTSEQHFAKFTATVSSPEVFLSFIAARTSTLRLRPMSTVMLSFNHPIRIAEQISSLDVLSAGRAELGGARSNNPWTLDGFGIAPKSTMEQRDECLRILGRALTQDEFSFAGKLYDIPPRRISPRAVQRPHPPVYISSTGVASHTAVGKMGLGVMSGNSILGWQYAQDCVNAYRAAIREPEPIMGTVNESVGLASLTCYCADSMEEARAIAAPTIFRIVDVVSEIYADLSTKSDDYAYLGQISQIKDHQRDLDYLLECAPYFTVGTPDTIIERIQRVEAMGVDEMILRIDGMGHAQHMRTLELIGRSVIPAFAKQGPSLPVAHVAQNTPTPLHTD